MGLECLSTILVGISILVGGVSTVVEDPLAILLGVSIVVEDLLEILLGLSVVFEGVGSAEGGSFLLLSSPDGLPIFLKPLF